MKSSMHPIGLAEFMGARLVEAGRDMPFTKPEMLFERFIAWTWVPVEPR